MTARYPAAYTFSPSPLPESGSGLAAGAAPQTVDPAQLRQAARLGILDDIRPRRPPACGERDYEFGCCCRDCKARAALAAELGYDPATGKLNPRPAPPKPRQPWEPVTS